jgi:hypothetical protein
VAKRAAEPGNATARTDRGDHAQGDRSDACTRARKLKLRKLPTGDNQLQTNLTQL